jgi:hypothetical protein
MKEPVITTESIQTRNGLRLTVEKRVGEQSVEVQLHSHSPKKCVLHWGVRREKRSEWLRPPPSSWPAGTTDSGLKAVQTPMSLHNGEGSLLIPLTPQPAFTYLDFVLFFPENGTWDNNKGKNYEVRLPRVERPGVAPLTALREYLGQVTALFERDYEVQGEGRLALAVTKSKNGYRVVVAGNFPGPAMLHWGFAWASPYEWLRPCESLWPPGTVLAEGHTAETPFLFRDGLQWQEFQFPEAQAPLGMPFVLHQVDTGHWLNNHGKNFYVPVRAAEKTA